MITFQILVQRWRVARHEMRGFRNGGITCLRFGVVCRRERITTHDISVVESM